MHFLSLKQNSSRSSGTHGALSLSKFVIFPQGNSSDSPKLNGESESEFSNFRNRRGFLKMERNHLARNKISIPLFSSSYLKMWNWVPPNIRLCMIIILQVARDSNSIESGSRKVFPENFRPEFSCFLPGRRFDLCDGIRGLLAFELPESGTSSLMCSHSDDMRAKCGPRIL